MAGINQKILVIDENPATEDFLNLILKNDSYDIQSNTELKEVIQKLKSLPSSYDAIFINPQTQGIDYIDFKRKVRKEPDLKSIPIIQIEKAAPTTEKDVQDLLKEVNEVIEFTTDIASGKLKIDSTSEISILKKSIIDKDDPNIFHLSAPLNPSIVRPLLSTLRDLLKEKRKIQNFFDNKKEGLDLILQTKAEISTHQQALNMADYLALFTPQFEDVRHGLRELLFNAIEHGNYNIGYEAKGELLKTKEFEAELEKRKKDPKYKKRKVEIVVEKRKEGIYIQITDEGDGFESKKYMEANPSRATHQHGRGIAISNKIYFDKIAYNEKGNQVTCFVSTKKRIRESFWD